MRRLAVIAAAALALLGAAPARADVFDDNPAAASRGANDFWVFARRSSDGAILVRQWYNGAWLDWVSLGGSFSSGPAAAAYGPYIEVFARGQDGATYTDALIDGQWSGWSSLGGYSTSAPAAIARRGTNYLDVAVKGGDNTMYLDTYVPGSGWHGWGSLAGGFTSAPALESQGDGVLDVYGRGTDGAVYERGWGGSAWSDWINLSGGIVGAPAAVNKQPHDVDLYVRGAANALYQDHWTSVSGWTGWFLVDSTPIGSSVAAVSDSASREILFSRTGDEMYAKTWTNPGGWTGWTDFGPVEVPPPPAPTLAPDGEVSLTTGIRCTPPRGKLRVSIKVRKPAGHKKAHVTKIVFFTKGRGARKRVDHRAPFVVHIQINRPAGGTGRIYARVYYTRGHSHTVHRKVVSRSYKVCA